MNQISILGEDRFYWYQKDGVIVINHPKWSAVGIGDDLSDAINDMINDALIIKPSYVNEPNKNLTDEAIKFKIWLAGIKKCTNEQG